MFRKKAGFDEESTLLNWREKAEPSKLDYATDGRHCDRTWRRYRKAVEAL